MRLVPAGDDGWLMILPSWLNWKTPLFCTVHHVVFLSPGVMEEMHGEYLTEEEGDLYTTILHFAKAE